MISGLEPGPGMNWSWRLFASEGSLGREPVSLLWVRHSGPPCLAWHKVFSDQLARGRAEASGNSWNRGLGCRAEGAGLGVAAGIVSPPKVSFLPHASGEGLRKRCWVPSSSSAPENYQDVGLRSAELFRLHSLGQGARWVVVLGTGCFLLQQAGRQAAWLSP